MLKKTLDKHSLFKILMLEDLFVCVQYMSFILKVLGLSLLQLLLLHLVLSDFDGHMGATCNLCGKAFNSTSHLASHTRRINTKK